MEQELVTLLAEGERTAFHGAPGEAIEVLERVLALARSDASQAQAAKAGWLIGVALGATGRFGGALTVLGPLLQAGEGPAATALARHHAALAAATAASVHRQLGRHAIARGIDQRGLELTDGRGEAACDCLLGLAADSLGLAEPAQARRQLATASGTVPEGVDTWWRQRVRLDWTRTELAWTDEQPVAALEAAQAAVQRAERCGAPRHVAKGLIFFAVAQVKADTGDPVDVLRRAAALAEGLGLVPLIWRARGMLAALLDGDDPRESARSFAAARSAVRALASDLPAAVRAEWLEHPDIKALLSTQEPSG